MKVVRPLLTTTVACDLTGHAADLDNWYTLVQSVPEALDGQHPIRLWEYSMTMRSIYAWIATQPIERRAPFRGGGVQVADVGGASSQFWRVLRKFLCPASSPGVTCIDPAYTVADAEETRTSRLRFVIPLSIAEALQQTPGTLKGQFDVVTCISVLEHVKPEALNGFLTDLTLLLRPGGLLALTCDYGELGADDTYHFHWMREQIFDAETVQDHVVDTLDRLGYNSLGAVDLTWKGQQVYDYSMLAAAFVYQPSEPSKDVE